MYAANCCQQIRKTLKTRQDTAIGSDGFLSGLLWAHNVAPTDPGLHTLANIEVHK